MALRNSDAVVDSTLINVVLTIVEVIEEPDAVSYDANPISDVNHNSDFDESKMDVLADIVKPPPRPPNIISIQLDEGVKLYSTFTHARFQERNINIFHKCMDHVEKCLSDAKMHENNIHDVVPLTDVSAFERASSCYMISLMRRSCP
ncbi:hypothetical protein QQ045_033584 [Rhodiola kirilowii]